MHVFKLRKYVCACVTCTKHFIADIYIIETRLKNSMKFYEIKTVKFEYLALLK